MFRNRVLQFENIIQKIHEEFNNAKVKHKDFETYHHGYAVILEELDELWDEIKKQKPNKENLKKEATQIAAMCIRFITDLL